MAVARLGPSTYGLDGVYLRAGAAAVGPHEGRGPLGPFFDRVWSDETNGTPSFEKAEQALLTDAYALLLKKAEVQWSEVDLVFGGDLLDQIVTTTFTARDHQRPLIGVFAACASFTEALGLGSLVIGGGGSHTVLAAASSHHFSAERQFRFPLELGYQRPPTAAWTATAAGAAMLGDQPSSVWIEAVTFGRVIDMGGKDPNDMGSAMAPAAFDTIQRHFAATNTRPDDYDAIMTGDLGHFGIAVLRHYAQDQGLTFGDELDDCGRSLYDPVRQDTHNGGSGPGCSAAVFCGPLLRALQAGEMQRLLLVATGALFSPTTYQQGETIPAIAHAVAFSRQEVT